MLETATQKCQAVYTAEIARTDVGEPTLVLAADTVICLASGQVLEKPKSPAHHMAMLQTLRDAGAHKVCVFSNLSPYIIRASVSDAEREYSYTAVVAMTPLEDAAHPGYAMDNHVEETIVHFDKTVTDALLMSYVKTGEGADKAGGYAIQGTGSILIEKIEGSYDNVVGLPVRSTLRLIEKVLSGDDENEDDYRVDL